MLAFACGLPKVSVPFSGRSTCNMNANWIDVDNDRVVLYEGGLTQMLHTMEFAHNNPGLIVSGGVPSMSLAPLLF